MQCYFENATSISVMPPQFPALRHFLCSLTGSVCQVPGYIPYSVIRYTDRLAIYTHYTYLPSIRLEFGP